MAWWVFLVTAKLQQQKCGESSVILTDFNQKVLENLGRNIALNNVADKCIVKGLDFDQQSGSCSLDTATAGTATATRTATSGGWKDLSGAVHAPVDANKPMPMPWPRQLPLTQHSNQADAPIASVPMRTIVLGWIISLALLKTLG